MLAANERVLNGEVEINELPKWFMEAIMKLSDTGLDARRSRASTGNTV